ncbi:hypothetical protein [Pedobacter agri]|uniref:hypothetical protein n=1 Tax=Pedobacter agri TaxID=454586 RepID=UPI0029309577|nr:hypothetical protein [Pedobacter agri]
MDNQENHVLGREPVKTEKLIRIVSSADHDQRSSNKLLGIQTRIGSLLKAFVSGSGGGGFQCNCNLGSRAGHVFAEFNLEV